MKKKVEQTETWYGILGTRFGIISVHYQKRDAQTAHNIFGYTKKNKIVPVKITYVR